MHDKQSSVKITFSNKERVFARKGFFVYLLMGFDQRWAREDEGKFRGVCVGACFGYVLCGGCGIFARCVG